MTESPVKYQLTIFDANSGAVHEKKSLSGTEVVHERKILKQQAIQRYLDRAESKQPVAHIEKYSPGCTKREYYRLVYRMNPRKLKRIHIKGGSTISELANYRRKKLQAMIDRGADLGEILAQLATFNGGSK